MKKGLTIFCAALLATGLAACKRGGANGTDEERLNAAAAQLDNSVYDTSADDATLNQVPADEGSAGNGAAANAAAPGNMTASNGTATSNRQ
jgi:hypothetical protein